MMYAVSYVSFFDNELRMTQVTADCPKSALCTGIARLMGSDHPDSIARDLMEFKSIEEIKKFMFDTDSLAEVMLIRERNQ
jgi:hypothetical protein